MINLWLAIEPRHITSRLAAANSLLFEVGDGANLHSCGWRFCQHTLVGGSRLAFEVGESSTVVGISQHNYLLFEVYRSGRDASQP